MCPSRAKRLGRLREAESTLAASSPQYDGMPAPATAISPARSPTAGAARRRRFGAGGAVGCAAGSALAAALGAAAA
ncbi:hypothetical protein GCM10009717_19430 [Agromyces allii]|uniref:Uncharacterized protein n=1 Tax=Agromyces allii TaxID=393607 RepID=A0ABN2QJL4_9MICO